MWDRLSKNIGIDEDFGEGDVSLGPLHEFSKLKVVDIEQKCLTGRYHFKLGRGGVVLVQDWRFGGRDGDFFCEFCVKIP